MSTNDYPNRDALRKANDIYLSAMRSLIKHQLQQVRGRSVEDLIEEALEKYDHQVDTFLQMLGENNDVEAAIDFNNIPHIIKKHWYKSFAQKFGQDLVAQNLIWMISKGRNSCEHIGTEDLDYEMTRAHLFMIAELLGIINRSDKQKEVEEIRDKFLTDSADDQISEMSEKLKASENDNSILKKDLADANIQIGKLKKQKPEKQEKIDALQDVKDEKEEIENELIALKADFKDTEDMWKDSEASLTLTKNLLEKVEKERDTSRDRVSELEPQLKDHELRIENISEKLNEAEVEKTNYKKELTKTREELEKIKTLHINYTERLESLYTERLESLEKEIKDTTAALHAAKKNLTEVGEQRISMEPKVGDELHAAKKNLTEVGEKRISMDPKGGDEDVVSSNTQKNRVSQSSRWSGNKGSREVVRDAVRELTQDKTDVEFTIKEVISTIHKTEPSFKSSTVRAQITQDCVNHTSRHHHVSAKSTKHNYYWRPSKGIYRLYDPDKDKIEDSY